MQNSKQKIDSENLKPYAGRKAQYTAQQGPNVYTVRGVLELSGGFTPYRLRHTNRRGYTHFITGEFEILSNGTVQLYFY